jgi:hypothetical protein
MTPTAWPLTSGLFIAAVLLCDRVASSRHAVRCGW